VDGASGWLFNFTVKGSVNPIETLPALPRHRTRDSFGRFVRQQSVPPGPDEGLSGELVLKGLRCLYASVPGGKAALARALAMKDRQQLAAMLRTGTGLKLEAVRRRCSRFLCQVARGELALERLPSVDSNPRCRWRAR
jgi:hypothetical protein